MSKVRFKGNAVNTVGDLPEVGTIAPDFALTGSDMSDVSIRDFAGKRMVLNIFPSLDTAVCAASVKRFNQEAAGLDNTVVLCISEDLPFAQSRFCGTEELEDVVTLSSFRYRAFANNYGVRIINGPLDGLMTRAVIVLDENRKVLYTQLVPEITEEPDYEGALKALR